MPQHQSKKAFWSNCRYLFGITAYLVASGLLISLACAAPDFRQSIRKGQKLFEDKKYTEALQKFEAATAAARSNREKQRLGRVLSQQALVLQSGGLYAKAVPYFELAIANLTDGADTANAIVNLNSLARTRILLGNYPDALGDLNSAQRLCDRLGQEKLTAWTLISFGYIHYNLREYRQSIDYLQDALRLAQKTNNQGLMADALFLQGGSYRQQGDFENAIGYLTEALDYYTALRRKPEIGAVSRNLGETYLHRIDGDKQLNLRQAETFLKRAITIHDQSQNDLELAMANSHMGELAYAMRDFSAAIVKYQKAQQTFEDLDFQDGIGRMHIHLGDAYLAQENFVAAIDSFNKALDIYRGLDDREWIRVALYGKGVSLEKMGDLAGAEVNYKRAVDVFESIRGDVSGGKEAGKLFTEANSKLYENLVELLLAKEDINGALEYIERSRLRSLREQIITSEPTTVRGDESDAATEYHVLLQTIATLKKSLHSTDDPESRVSLKTELLKSEADLLVVIDELSLEYGSFAGILNLFANTIQLRQAPAYPTDLAILVYYVTSENLYIFIVKKGDRSSYRHIKVSREAMRVKVIQAKRLIKETATRAVASERHLELRRLLAELYDLLLRPIESEIADIETIAVLPHDWLNYLPFEAMIRQDATDQQARFLMQTKKIVYLTSRTSVNLIQRLVEDRDEVPINSVVAFGNPDLGFNERNLVCGDSAAAGQLTAFIEPAERQNRFAPLPCAEKEVENIIKYFPNSVILTREKASKDNFLNHWNRHAIIHVAAHAKLTERGSELLLAPEEKGTLTRREIIRLNKTYRNKTTRFIALSACQTAIDPFLRGKVNMETKSAIEPATALAGTVHGFLYVGVPAVVATLWSISDEATPLLMDTFYSNLKNGQTFLDAFRNAQLQMIQRNDRFSQPYYWAGFVYFGLPD